jgi:hypothetical protein
MEQAIVPVSHIVTHAGSILIIEHCGQHATRLIHSQDHSRVIDHHALTINLDHGICRIYAQALLPDYDAVDFYTTLFNELLAGAPTTNACSSENFLKADCAWLVTHR